MTATFLAIQVIDLCWCDPHQVFCIKYLAFNIAEGEVCGIIPGSNLYWCQGMKEYFLQKCY